MFTPLYFSAADRQLENFLDAAAFDRSLLLNVLFQQRILIPDVFFFISRGLERHLHQRSAKSLFEASIEKRIIVPFFRDMSCRSFSEILRVIRGGGDPNQAIQGLLDSADQVAARLDIAAANTSDFSACGTETHLGKAFEKLLEKRLSRDEPPENLELPMETERDFLLLWKATRPWRMDAISEARNQADRCGYSGVRRGDIQNAVGRHLGLAGDFRVHDIGVLFAHFPQRERELRAFFKWVCELYHYNHAMELRAKPQFPVYDALSGPIVGSVLPTGKSARNSASTPVVDDIQPFPPLDVLQRVPPREILSARDDFGPPFFAALEVFRRTPSEDHADTVRKAFRDYGQAILKVALKTAQFAPSFLGAQFGSGATPNRNLLNAAFALSVAIEALYRPWIRPIVALGPFGYAIYVLYRTIPAAKVRLEVKGHHYGDTQPREISFPAGGDLPVELL